MSQGQTSVLSFIKSYAARLQPKPAQPVSVLIVDDEEPVRKFVNRVLSEAGYATTVAGGGPDAIRAAADGSFDIVVTDVMMPEMTGDELARRLRQVEPDIKVLYLTGYSDSLFREKVLLWDDEAYLDKPCTVKSLRQAVSLLLFDRFDAPAAAELSA